MYVAEDGVLVG